MANRGTRVKARERDGIVTVKALMSHPMESGMRKDKKTGELVPAHFIEEITCKAGGKKVYTAMFGGAVSKNPYFSFKFKGAVKGDMFELSWKDNKGKTDKTEIVIK